MNYSEYISNFVKYQRNRLKLTQEELAERAGVGLRFIRDLEQGKETLRLDKVNQVLQLFGYVLSPKSDKIHDPYAILLHHFNRNVHIRLKNTNVLVGVIVEAVYEGAEITNWKFVSNNNALAYKSTNNPDLVQTIKHSDIEDVQNI